MLSALKNIFIYLALVFANTLFAATDSNQFSVDDHLRLTNFNHEKFIISNTDANSNLVIHNNIPNEKKLKVIFNCNFGKKNWVFEVAFKKSVSILMPPNISDCYLEYTGGVSGKSMKVKIQNELKAFPFLKDLKTADQVGHVTKKGEAVLPIEKVFKSTELPNTTGITATNSFEPLTTPESGFREKMKALLGYDVGSEFIKNQNPFAPLSFAKAPKLDAVFVSSLVFRSDFYGTALSRALKYHAEQGALINIVTTKYMMFDKDKKLLETLASEHPNFRLQEFKYHDPKYNIGRPFRLIDSTFRNMHVKMFVTLAKNPENNVVIFGGRNVHDGFLFTEKPDYKKFPELIQYGTEDKWVHWNDFEMKLTSKEIASNTYAHLNRFWHRDSFTQEMNEASAVFQKKSFSDKNTFRHVMSLPYNDQQALEKLFVKMIDSASSSIKLSSPYLRPTPKIAEALERVASRGVDISIQTRINLAGDTQAWLYSEVNKESINRFYKKMKVYEWKENSILHSKFMLIDDKVSFIGSVNLSRRSFIQDVENGFLIHSEDVTKKMGEIFDGYIAKSLKIGTKQSRKCLASALIFLLKNQF